jgi:predicted DNA-binding protein
MSKEIKHKNICISMNPESLQQLKEIHDKTGKSKSRIVRDAIKKEHKEIRK